MILSNARYFEYQDLDSKFAAVCSILKNELSELFECSAPVILLLITHGNQEMRNLGSVILGNVDKIGIPSQCDQTQLKNILESVLAILDKKRNSQYNLVANPVEILKCIYTFVLKYPRKLYQ